MSKTFRGWKIDEPLLLPPTVGDFVAEDHLDRFMLTLVRDDIDLAEITGSYGSERGQPPFDPTMMTTQLLYSYCCGIYSSRRIAKACRERVDFMSTQCIRFGTVSDFGTDFATVREGRLVKLGHVALDGTKIKANASKYKAMSYGMENRAAELEADGPLKKSADEAERI
jgi:transposase